MKFEMKILKSEIIAFHLLPTEFPGTRKIVNGVVHAFLAISLLKCNINWPLIRGQQAFTLKSCHYVDALAIRWSVDGRRSKSGRRWWWAVNYRIWYYADSHWSYDDWWPRFVVIIDSIAAIKIICSNSTAISHAIEAAIMASAILEWTKAENCYETKEEKCFFLLSEVSNNKLAVFSTFWHRHWWRTQIFPFFVEMTLEEYGY